MQSIYHLVILCIHTLVLSVITEIINVRSHLNKTFQTKLGVLLRTVTRTKRLKVSAAT